MKKILTINPGSTSTKYKVFDMQGNVCEEHTFSLREEKKEHAFLKSLSDIQKIGIRVVHGGDIRKTSKITPLLKKKIIEYLDFAPIHNARALETIEKIEKIFTKTTVYASFDTAFHQSIPVEHTTYMINHKLAKKYKLRKYGFHGIAVQSAYEQLKLLVKKRKEKLPQKVIVAHLGGGCSITAIQKGKSYATSMELTPLSGIPMITRSGSIDPDIFSILHRRAKMSSEEISEMLNRQSGFYGMMGTKDTLKIMNRAQEGKEKEKLAVDIFINEIVQKIWAYAGLMQGLDVVVFSGGIGYGNAYLRGEVYKKIKKLGLTKKDIFVIDVDEERLIFDEIKSL